MNDTLPVAQLSGTRKNFDLRAFLPSTVTSQSRVDFTVMNVSLNESQAGLASGKTTSITVEFMALVTKEACQSYSELCVEVDPAHDSSYLSPPSYTGNRLCHNASKYIKCFGE